jgi:hypothetical protein
MHPANDKPKHKPNPKHTLEEILKSLQDLIRNDLLEGEAPQETGASAADATPSTSAAAPGGELEALRHSLETLVSEELTAEDARAVEQPADDQPAPAAAAPTEAAIPREGLQEMLPFDAEARAVSPDEALASGAAGDDTLQFETLELAAPPEVATPGAIEPKPGAAPDAVENAAVHPSSDEPGATDAESLVAFDVDASQAMELTSPTSEAPLPSEPIDERGADEQPVRAADAHEPEPLPDTGAPETAGDWDDIPVLEEVVAEVAAEYEPGAHEHAPAGETAAEQQPPANLALPLPAPSRAHDLAVRTVAKLNIELRKAGKRPLDAKVIARLAMMLRETLESDAAKVENKPQE